MLQEDAGDDITGFVSAAIECDLYVNAAAQPLNGTGAAAMFFEVSLMLLIGQHKLN